MSKFLPPREVFHLCLGLLLSGGLLVLCSGCTESGQALAVDDANAPTPAARSWETLISRMREIEARAEEIRDEFGQATPARQSQLQMEYQRLGRELNDQIFPELAQLAPRRLEQVPDDVDAAEIVMQLAFQENRFWESARLADLVLEKDPANVAALNFGGASHFAIHDFELASELLTRAQEQGLLVPDIGGQYVSSARDYQAYWATEQAIREQEAAAQGEAQLPRVLLKTSRGEILLELFENEAPNTVANFISLVEDKFYDGLKFHRVIPGFMAQGGCPNTRAGSNGLPGSGGPGHCIACECYAENARRHFAGTLSMAHAGRNTGGSQFFITHLPTPHLDRDVRPESVHTVFGRVVEGMEVVAALQVSDVIESATVVRKRNHPYEPIVLPPR